MLLQSFYLLNAFQNAFIINLLHKSVFFNQNVSKAWVQCKNFNSDAYWLKVLQTFIICKWINILQTNLNNLQEIATRNKISFGNAVLTECLEAGCENKQTVVHFTVRIRFLSLHLNSNTHHLHCKWKTQHLFIHVISAHSNISKKSVSA